ncbi:hypothetical protein M2092_002091 [Fusobacterium sp. PH5-44]
MSGPTTMLNIIKEYEEYFEFYEKMGTKNLKNKFWILYDV